MIHHLSLYRQWVAVFVITVCNESKQEGASGTQSF